MSIMISYFILLMFVCFNTGFIAIAYGMVTRTWQYVVLSPISMYCSYELICAAKYENVMRFINTF